MSTMVPNRRSSSGMSCAQCGNELITPEWSEYRSKQQKRHLWRCWKCDYCFETIVTSKLIEDNAIGDDISPLQLVA
jgi:RNase P subunit RPR2